MNYNKGFFAVEEKEGKCKYCTNAAMVSIRDMGILCHRCMGNLFRDLKPFQEKTGDDLVRIMGLSAKMVAMLKAVRNAPSDGADAIELHGRTRKALLDRNLIEKKRGKILLTATGKSVIEGILQS